MTAAVVIGDVDLQSTLRGEVVRQGVTVSLFSSLQSALESKPGVIFTTWLPEDRGAPLLDALRGSQEVDPPVPIVVFVPRGLPTLLHRALAAGAADVLSLPLDPDEVEAELRELLGQASDLPFAKRSVYERLLETVLLGASKPFRRCLLELRQAAACDANVLLLGETGVGKEMFARAIHELSWRSSEPYLAVNCAGLPEQLLESELFGHSKGAFTGAERARSGRFSAVRAGTLLLDEIGDIAPVLQIKLLRGIEAREFQPVGENASLPFQGRLIAATSVDLDQGIQDGRFRTDLLGRLNHFRIHLPPLRERREDIPLLTRCFLDKHGRGRGLEISPGAMDVLLAHPFPMNVRQLENTIIYAIARSAPGRLILPKHLPPEFFQTSGRENTLGTRSFRIRGGLSYAEARDSALVAVDKIYLEELLNIHGGNQSAAAEAAGIDRKTFAARYKTAQSQGGT